MLLKKLTDATGLPGFEDEIRSVIRDELKDHVDKITVDRMGNLLVVKNEASHGRHIVLSAHMDEVGLLVKHIDKNGLIKFDIWGIDPRVLVSKTVLVGKNRVPGVIGIKPVHLQSPDERKVAIKPEILYVDIGTDSKDETDKLVSIGDFIAFDSEYTEFGRDKIKAKALDDRVGCAAIIEILKSDTPHRISAAFVVQEEVGMRGSRIAANQLAADLVINIEGTICADTESVPEHLQSTVQGCGPALSIMDRTSVYLKKYLNDIIKTAEERGIPWQYRRTGAGGTDSANYHVAHGGTPVIGIAVPCRYIHSNVSVMDRRDYYNLVTLLRAYIEEFCYSAKEANNG